MAHHENDTVHKIGDVDNRNSIDIGMCLLFINLGLDISRHDVH